MPGSGRPPGRTRTWQVSHETLCRRLTHENYGSATEHERFGNKGQAHPQGVYRPSASRSSTSSNLNCSSPSGSSAPASTSSQVTGVATVGSSRPRSEYGEIVVFEPAFWRPVEEDLPRPHGLGHGRRHQPAVLLARSSATSLASAVESSGSLRRAGRRTGAGPCCRWSPARVSRPARPAARAPAGPPGSTRAGPRRLARVEVDDEPVRVAAACPPWPTVHCCTCSSSAARLASQVRVARSSTTGKTRTSPFFEAGPRAGRRHLRRAHPRRRAPGGMFFSKKLCFSTPLGQRIRVTAAVRQQRQHRRRRPGRSSRAPRPWWCRCAGRAPCRGCSA